MIVAFVDPGKTGGLAVYKGTLLVGYAELKYQDFDSIKAARSILEEHTPSKVVIEATAWRANPMKICAKYSAGVMIGSLGLQRLPVEFVSPTTWRKQLFGNSKADKGRALTHARHKTGDNMGHDVAEAICMGEAWVNK